MKPFILVCLVIASIPHTALARPVSYPGGWTVMQMNDMDAHSLHVHYSPTAKYSIGYKAEYRRDKDWQFHGLQLNTLLKRWNKPTSQANFYLMNGVGFAHSDFGELDSETEGAAFTGLALDWEDRRYFTSYENSAVYAGDIDQYFNQKARIGIAPYIGDYGDVHTWLMLQVDHAPEKPDHFIVTPMVRIFKSEYLAEAGVSEDGDVMVNWVLQF